MLSALEKKIVALIQGDIAVTERPYLGMAQQLSIPEERLLQILKDLCDRGVIRRFGATLRHQKSGYTVNVMVAWQVEDARIDTVGQNMAKFRQVSHCYRRDPTETWPYNLYTMIHARDAASCRKIVREIAERTAVSRYTLLFSKKELKKTSMAYFSEVMPLNG
jgi:DNA-binding Lrp family transcriptional regulator